MPKFLDDIKFWSKGYERDIRNIPEQQIKIDVNGTEEILTISPFSVELSAEQPEEKTVSEFVRDVIIEKDIGLGQIKGLSESALESLENKTEEGLTQITGLKNETDQLIETGKSQITNLTTSGSEQIQGLTNSGLTDLQSKIDDGLESLENKTEEGLNKLQDKIDELDPDKIAEEIDALQEFDNTHNNIENGQGSGSLQQKDFVYTGDSIVFEDKTKGTQNGDTIPGAIAIGEGAVALGGLRYDYYTSPETHAANLLIDPTCTENWGRTPTSAEGVQSFAGGGSSHAYGDWSFAFGKDAKAYQKCSICLGGSCVAGNEAGDNSLYSFSMAGGERTVSKGRSCQAFGADCHIISSANSSFAVNRRNVIHNSSCALFGTANVSQRDNQFICGTLSGFSPDGTIFKVGNGIEINKSSLENADACIGYYYMDSVSLTPILINDGNKTSIWNNPSITTLQKRSDIINASFTSFSVNGKTYSEKLQIGRNSLGDRLQYYDFSVIGKTEFRNEVWFNGGVIKSNVRGEGLQLGEDSAGNRLINGCRFAVAGKSELRGNSYIAGKLEVGGENIFYSKVTLGNPNSSRKEYITAEKGSLTVEKDLVVNRDSSFKGEITAENKPISENGLVRVCDLVDLKEETFTINEDYGNMTIYIFNNGGYLKAGINNDYYSAREMLTDDSGATYYCSLIYNDTFSIFIYLEVVSRDANGTLTVNLTFTPELKKFNYEYTHNEVYPYLETKLSFRNETFRKPFNLKDEKINFEFNTPIPLNESVFQNVSLVTDPSLPPEMAIGKATFDTITRNLSETITVRNTRFLCSELI